MSEGGSRRAVAEIRFGEERTGITKVGGRSIHQFWTLLSPHFRDVLLAPQRRTDDGGVAWTWRESLEKRPLTAADLAGVRKRLERANESFAENPVNPLMGEDRGGTSSQALVDQVAAKVKALAESLSAKSDAALAEFVCRTETGIMVHSWGVASAAQVIYPESLETGISGVVLTGGKPLEGYEVAVENVQGLSVARTRSDSAGQFNFSKIGPGRYRVRVVSGRVKFPAKGSMVTVERGAVAQLELRSTADSDAQADQKSEGADDVGEGRSTGSSETKLSNENGSRKWIGRAAGVLVLLALVIGGGVWAWKKWMSGENKDERVVVRRSTMAPEDFSAGPGKSDVSRSSAGDGGGLGASVDGVGRPAHLPVSATGRSSDSHVSTSATGREKLPSSIGSKVEVQSGVGTSVGATDVSAGNIGLENEVADEAKVEESASVDADLARTNSDTSTKSALRKPKPPTGSGMGGQISGRKAAGSQGLEVAGVVDAGEKPLPGGTGSEGAVSLAKAKKEGAVTALGALPSNAQAVGGDALDRINAPGDSPSTEVDNEISKADKQAVGVPQEKGPVSKVLVVNKGSVPGTSDAGELFQPNDAGVEVGAKPAATVRPKSKQSGVKKPKTSAGAAAAGGAKTEDASPEDVPESGATAMQPVSLEKTDSTAGLQSSNAGNAAEKSTREPERGVSGKAAPSGALAKQADVQKQNIQPQRLNPAAAQSAREQSATEPAALTDLTDGGGATGTKSTNYEIEGVRWMVRLVRDAIVPTLPVKDGEVEAVAAARDRMMAERRTRVPETIRQHATQLGFAFSVPEALAGGTIYWREENDSVKRTVNGLAAEIVWTDEISLRPGVAVLLTSDGREIVRISVNEKGGIALKVVEGVRASLNFGVERVVSDEATAGTVKHEPRFFWQVNGVARKTQALRADDAKYDISFPLEKSKAPQMEVALTDRISGWAVVSRVSIRNGRP